DLLWRSAGGGRLLDKGERRDRSLNREARIAVEAWQQEGARLREDTFRTSNGSGGRLERRVLFQCFLDGGIDAQDAHLGVRGGAGGNSSRGSGLGGRRGLLLSFERRERAAEQQERA